MCFEYWVVYVITAKLQKADTIPMQVLRVENLIDITTIVRFRI